jgi:hypothetical protein
MIKLIYLALVFVFVFFPLNVRADLVNVLDKSTVLVPRTDFDALVARASLTDSSLCCIEQINMRLTDSGGLQQPAVLEVDYAINVAKKDSSLVSCLTVKEGILTLLSATGENGPVNVAKQKETYSVILNGEGSHHIKLMFNVSSNRLSEGYITSFALRLPETGQAWFKLDMNSPSIRLLESFGDIQENVTKSHTGFTSSSFIKNRGNVRLVWSRAGTLPFDDGAASIMVKEPGRIVVDYLYPVKIDSLENRNFNRDPVPAFSSLLRIDSGATLTAVSGYMRVGDKLEAGPRSNSQELAYKGNLNYSRCGDYSLVHGDRPYEYLGLKIVADSKIWTSVGRGRFTVSLPVVSVTGVKTAVFISSDEDVDVLSVSSPGAEQSAGSSENSSSGERLQNILMKISGANSGNVDLMKHLVLSKDQTRVNLRVRTLSNFINNPHDFAVSGFEANIVPSFDELSIMVHERFGIINRGSTVFPLAGMPSEAKIVAAYSAGVRVTPFLLETKSVPGSEITSSIGIPVTFFGSNSKPSRGLVDIYYSVDTSRSSDVSLYGFEYVNTKSKITLYLLKDWTGALTVSGNRYELGEFSEENLSDDPSTKDDPLSYPLSLKTNNTKKRTFRLAPVESMPVGLKAALHEMANIPSEDNSSAIQGDSLYNDTLPSGSSLGSEQPRGSGLARRSAPVLNVSLLSPVSGHIRLEIVFLAFLGLFCSFVIKNERLGTGIFWLSAIILLCALFYGPFDQNVMMTLASAVVVAGLTWISFFILKKCSFERDCND